MPPFLGEMLKIFYFLFFLSLLHCSVRQAKSQDLGKYSKIEKLKEFLFNSLLAESQEEPVCTVYCVVLDFEA